ncbi:MAG: hypothetical protein C0432_00330 [Candidatus Puniceispirillum sp.]|nr:hypothetical protein [Candidatus Puniceispirillum sp.]
MSYGPATNHSDILKSIIDEMNISGEYSTKSINHLSNIIENILSLQNAKDLGQIDIDSLKKHIIEEYTIIHDYSTIQENIKKFEKSLLPADSKNIKKIIHFLTDKNFFFLGTLTQRDLSRNDNSSCSKSGLFKFSSDSSIFNQINHYIHSIENNTIQKIPVISPYHRHSPLVIAKLATEKSSIILVGLFTRKFYNLLPLQDPYLNEFIPTDKSLNFQHLKSEYEKDTEDLFYSFPNDEFLFSETRHLLQKTKKIIIEQKAFTVVHLRTLFTDEFYVVFKNNHFKEASFQKFYEQINRKYIHVICIQKINGNKYDLIQITCQKQDNYDNFIKKIKECTEEELYSWDEKLRKIFKKQELDFPKEQIFSEKYKLYFSPKQACKHLEKINSLTNSDKGIDLNIEIHSAENFSIEIVNKTSIFNLSEVIPLLDNFKIQVISENSFDIHLRDKVYIVQKFHCISKWINQENIILLNEILLLCLEHEYPRDNLNALSLTAYLDHTSIQSLRAYIHYLLQINVTMNLLQAYQNCLIYPQTTQLLMEIFNIRFQEKSVKNEKIIEKKIKQFHDFKKSCKSKPSITFFESLLNVILATVRTNVNLKKDYLSFKIKTQDLCIKKSQSILFEIFVFNHLMEGIHLRADKVSRGGLRWSERYSDYRDEIYDLVQAQTVKNAVIVPSGSKGGFISKRYEKLKSQGASKQTLANEMVSCYTTFISGLLDITDNYTTENVQAQHPINVICYDELDPYLVVAADKGTAQLSDTANQIASQYNFWLGDAFASGGKNGFSHKDLAITSRGAWTSLVEHMRNQNISFNDSPSFIGVGDMSGDVFGNGMLLSNQIKLIAAFDHRHIFIDPSPNIENSYKERKRLFDLPLSSWADYDTKVLSKGGAVFPRDSASITLNAKIKKLLHMPQEQKSTTPDELIQYILKCNCDCIWFGGIGTYVKASFENNNDIADSMNHTLRVNANQIQAKIIVEGANLAVTREGRREFDKCGGSINTDGFDNSAGVNCSDHEVNFKLLFKISEIEDSIDIHKFEKGICEKIVNENSKLNRLCTNFFKDELLAFQNLNDFATLFEENQFSHYYHNLHGIPKNLKELTRPDLCVVIANAYIHIKKELIQLFSKDINLVINQHSTILKQYFSIKDDERLCYEKHQLGINIIALEIAHKILQNLGPIESMYFARHKNIFKDMAKLDTFIHYLTALENMEIQSFIEFSTLLEIILNEHYYSQKNSSYTLSHSIFDASIPKHKIDLSSQQAIEILFKSFVHFRCETLDQRFIRSILLKEIVMNINTADSEILNQKSQDLLQHLKPNEFNFNLVREFCSA